MAEIDQTKILSKLERQALLPTREVLRLTGRSRTTLNEMIAAGRFPKGGVIGSRRYFRAGDVEDWLASPFEAERGVFNGDR